MLDVKKQKHDLEIREIESQINLSNMNEQRQSIETASRRKVDQSNY